MEARSDCGFTHFDDDVDDDEAQGLWHGDGADRWPFDLFWVSVSWGVAPGWDIAAPLALTAPPLSAPVKKERLPPSRTDSS